VEQVQNRVSGIDDEVEHFYQTAKDHERMLW
jgi:hypothetical protein